MTFAGSPDRVEARLVPEAGYELDTFEISGFPRRPSLALLRSLFPAGRAPRACAAILKRRRPHVVLGGGGYVAGPMVYAAWRRKLPAALTEADAHLGLANRLAAPFARRVFLAYEIAGRDGAKYRVTGRPVPAAHRGVSQAEGRRRFGLSGSAPVLAFFGALAGARSLNDFAVETYGDAGPAVLHVSRRARLRAACARGCTATTIVLVPSTNEFGAALAAPDLAISRAGGTVWELAAAGTPAILVPYPHATGDHQTLNARHFERGGGAVVVPEAELDARARARRRAARRPRAARVDARGDAVDGASARGGRDRGGADRACSLCSVGGSGSSGSAAPACRRTRSSRAPGAPRSAAGTASRRRTCARSRGSRSCCARAGRAGRLGGRRLERVPGVAGTSRADFLAELVSLRRSIVVAGAHGKTTTTGMIAFVLAELGLDPAWLVGGEIAQLGGNAGAGEGWLVVEGDESDRTVERLRPQIAVVTNVELDHHSTFASAAEVAELFERWLAERAAGRARLGARAGVVRAPASPGEHNRRNAAAALAALELAGVARADAEPVLARFRGAGRRFELVGEQGGVTVVDDYAHHPTRDRGHGRRGARADGRPRARPLPAAPLLPHAPPRARARRGALRLPTPPA